MRVLVDLLREQDRARQVGDILMYVPDDTIPDPRYRFYM
jgi:hypothetical protein